MLPSELTNTNHSYYEARTDLVSPLGSDPKETFSPLLEALRQLRGVGIHTPLKSMIGEKLKTKIGHIYQSSGIKTFKAYTELAEKEGLIILIPRSNGPGTERMSLSQDGLRKAEELCQSNE
ncbi:uncharacterized protein EI90DRAFT_3045515 [Cantharellus anzutake]|uniref:uncharacterized protein n=1 Tax=Cantharellus anzutake TaxID=1750568 RepID=UPI0019076DF3|nr:uncharacterized protein EI90DRAFT_3045515 [Cantharellus anzutake]KAF8336366.1 hypothetical protein EI90DRAFT_3045515 [Cantharellus anzutake]